MLWSTQPKQLALPGQHQRAVHSSLNQFASGRRGQQIVRHAHQNPEHSERSYDADDELDFAMGAEFDRVSNPEKFSKLAEHLELMWKISGATQSPTRGRPSTCQCCAGTGELECSFCHGTGALTLGDTLYCSETGCKPCPACSSRGYTRCSYCTGTGFRASWMTNEGCPTH